MSEREIEITDYCSLMLGDWTRIRLRKWPSMGLLDVSTIEFSNSLKILDQRFHVDRPVVSGLDWIVNPIRSALGFSRVMMRYEDRTFNYALVAQKDGQRWVELAVADTSEYSFCGRVSQEKIRELLDALKT